MNFFIATVGRSGSVWLSQTLNKSPSHRVCHEEADESPQSHIRAFAPFPIHRFSEPNYGEVHGYLRYHLSPLVRGAERLVPRRGILTRETRKVVTSWMNRDNRKPEIDELAAVIFEVLTQQRILAEWAASDPEARVFRLEDLSSSLTALKNLFDWLDLDYTPVPQDLTPQNQNDNGHRKIWFRWDDDAEALLQQLASRQPGALPLLQSRKTLNSISGDALVAPLKA